VSDSFLLLTKTREMVFRKPEQKADPGPADPAPAVIAPDTPAAKPGTKPGTKPGA
jgi:hypothetical protein